jgi:hypothetical protein
MSSPKPSRGVEGERRTRELNAAAARFSTPARVICALNTEYLLGVRALRRQEENKVREGEIANNRKRFELVRDAIYLVFELIAVLAMLAIAVILAVSGHGALSLIPLGGGVGFGGLVALLHQRPRTPPPS